MTSVNQPTRLSKAARELNVGISTIVDFLHKHGIKLDSNPNTKIAADHYQMLLKEFGSDHDLKEKSKQLQLNTMRRTESSSADDTENVEDNSEVKPTEDVVSEIKDEVMIKDTSSTARTEKKVEFIDTKAKSEIDIKVVGKIDLEKKKEEKSEEPAAKSETTETPSKPEHKETLPDPKAEKKVEKVVETKKEEPVAQPKKVEEKIEKKEEVKPVIKEEKKVEEKVNEAPIERKEELVNNKIDIEDKVKVVGMIDLSSINQRTRPPKKTKKQKEDERKERERVKKEEHQKNHPNAKKGGNGGPAGTTNETEADRQKKKRKRIRKDKVNVNDNVPKPGDAQRKPGVPHDKKKAHINTNTAANKKRRPIRNEVNEDDVQKQIKDTLARLTSKTKSNKGAKYRREKRNIAGQRVQDKLDQIELEKNIVKVTEFISVNELASMMDISATDVIQTCMNLGLFVSINQRLDAETMALVADEYNYTVEFVSAELQDQVKEDEDAPEDLIPRPPIVTVMGHVDHGKTSLLDYIRHANVIAGEAGGITQHIGAYNVELDSGKRITFLDTPGHEAFTAMRARGAQVTDIAIIIVAADDSVMPQTVEAINHASAAGVPIVFAINKIDRPNANVHRIKEQLANMNYMTEDWGGKYQSQDISAKEGIGITELLEKVMLESELLDLKANPNKRATGTVIESSLDKGRGYVATVLVENGTMNLGDVILAGDNYGHVKAMYNERGTKIDKVGPASPVQILGLNGAPQAGDKFHIMESDKEARDIANKREQLQREQGLRTQKHITLDEIGRRIAIGNFQELNVIVKGDVDGSIEALSDALIKLSTEEIQVNVKHKAVGQISESDILLAAASNAIIIGFQVRPSLSARKLAEKEEIDIRLYSIIYDAINELRDAMEGMLSPEIKEQITSTIEIRETFKITKVGTIAGCMVKEGKINRNSRIRLIRDGIVIYTGELGSLKRFKDDVKEVATGYECGLNIKGYNDIKVGDHVESFEEVEVKKTL